jgi:hypothetical protein
VDPLRLPPRGRVGERPGRGPGPVQPVAVPPAGLDPLALTLVVPAVAGLEGQAPAPLELDLDPVGQGRPDAERGPALPEIGRAEPRAGTAYDDAPPSCLRNTMPSGGSVSSTDRGRPCMGTGSDSTPPRFPTPLPP